VNRFAKFEDTDFWEGLPLKWKKGRDVAVAALLSGTISVDELPVDHDAANKTLVAGA